MPTARPGRVTDLSQENLATMLALLYDHGPLARAEIVDQLGAGAATVSRLTARLIDAGLVTEAPRPAAAADIGRPRVPLDLVREGRLIGAVHVGATHLRVGLIDLSGKVAWAATEPHVGTSPKEVSGEIVRQLRRAIRRSDTRVVGIGVAMGGWIDDGSVVRHEPLDWTDVDLQAQIAGRLKLPTYLESHVRALALAEMRFGAAHGTASLVELHIGNVVDAAVMVNGALHCGPRSSAGAIGHLQVQPDDGRPCSCGARGCLEAEASDHAVLMQARSARLPGRLETLEDVVRLADEGNPAADDLLVHRARAVGRAAGLVLDLINPELLVITGARSGHSGRYLSEARAAATAAAHTRPDVAHRIVASGLGDDALLMAACSVVLTRYLADPMTFEPGLAIQR